MTNTNTTPAPIAWVCQGGGGCGTSNPDHATHCGGCQRPW